MTLDGDIYVRYQTIDPTQLRSEAERTRWEKSGLGAYLRHMLISKMPVKIDIGAIYSDSPVVKSSRHPLHAIKGAGVIPKEKEICFDIDMTDYDPVRLCCSGADICPKCWPLMQMAVDILRTTLGKAFGLKHLLFVYSGRRGIHCWVCDPQAREWSPVIRSALAEYVQLLTGASGPGEHGAAESRRMTLFRKKSEIIVDSVKIIDKYWSEYVLAQGIFEGSNFQKVTGFIRNAEHRNEANSTLKKIDNPKDRSLKFESMVRGFSKFGEDHLSEIKLQFCYPRLDINVSKDLHHLLKSPFSVHPKTDRVCVPFEDVKNFDPFVVPTTMELCKQYNEGDKSLSGYQRTALAPYIKIFDDFLEAQMQAEIAFNNAAGVTEERIKELTGSPKRRKLAGMDEMNKENEIMVS